MTVTAKYCIIAFGVLPLGMAASAVACDKSPWSLAGVAAWTVVTMLLLRKLRCPRCGARVAPPFGLDPFSRAFFESFACGIILIRCMNCGHELNH
jgi:hypothetical protein